MGLMTPKFDPRDPKVEFNKNWYWSQNEDGEFENETLNTWKQWGNGTLTPRIVPGHPKIDML